MTERLTAALRVCGWLLLLLAAAAAPVLFASWMWPTPATWPVSPVVLGIIEGLATCGSVVATNLAVWVMTGRSVLDRLSDIL